MFIIKLQNRRVNQSIRTISRQENKNKLVLVERNNLRTTRRTHRQKSPNNFGNIIGSEYAFSIS